MENKYLHHIQLKVETPLKPPSAAFAGYPYERLSDEEIVFTLPDIDEIPGLIKALATCSPIYAAEIINRDLETLYFTALIRFLVPSFSQRGTGSSSSSGSFRPSV